jgi:hypothetical protein
MKRILFTLSMPNSGSWNGKWSGEGRAYCKTKTITDKRAGELGILEDNERNWYHHWSDGWTACISGRILKKGERAPKSAGFCGYDWMVTNIWLYNSTSER